MFVSFLYVILAVLGLSFLIFIHELGHYWMARRVGMRVETFALGFGKPIYTWEHKGTKWQINWLLFGGYVKIAGVDLEKDKNPYEVKDGFFGKSPLDRIKVAFMGPLTNILFALVAFGILWAVGGREKNFSEFTGKIGWVDTESELYANGIRPGDEITAYNTQSYQNSKDHVYSPMTASDKIDVHGSKINYATGQKTPFEYSVKTYSHPFAIDFKTAGITQPANYIIYDRFADGRENPLPEGSPLIDSGIQYGDRIYWIDGELIFSSQQLNQLLNGNYALLTIERDGKRLLARVPRVNIKELKQDAQVKEELIDWQFEAGLQGNKIQNLYYIPYNLTNDGIVEEQLKFIDKDNQNEAFPSHQYSSLENPLLTGDKIVAIYGIPIKKSYELLKELQTYKVNVIVQREHYSPISTEQADTDFNREIEWDNLMKITDTIGSDHPIQNVGNLYLLKAITPKPRNEFTLSPEKQALLNKELADQKKAIDSIEDSQKRNHALQIWNKQEKRLLLGLPSIQDRKVQYNPGPLALLENVAQEIARTLSALISGALNPKWIAGPIGIVQMVHDNSMTSFKEALYWLGAISLNLGMLNLLPIPVLDGGTILMSLMELITGKRMNPKTMEKLILPFGILLIGFFIFLTYNDIVRLITSLLH
jgi:regulator of sigma E protease